MDALRTVSQTAQTKPMTRRTNAAAFRTSATMRRQLTDQRDSNPEFVGLVVMCSAPRTISPVDRVVKRRCNRQTVVNAKVYTH